MADEQKGNGKGRHFEISLSKQSRDFSYKVENFNLWPLDAAMKTPNFYLEPNLTFYASLQVKNTIYGMETLPQCHLSFHLEEGNDIRIDHIALVTNSSGNVLHRFTPMSYMYQGVSSKECELDPCLMENLLYTSKDRVLIFKWTMEYVKFTENVPCKHTPRPASVNLLNLTNQLKEMYIEAQNADTTLKVGDVDLPVHKCVLSKRSPVFAKMFETNGMEYPISDLQLSVLQGLLEFLYSATLCNDDFGFVHDLYHASDLFQVDDLKTTCVSLLLSKLDVENACQVLLLAHDHQDDSFKTSVMDFILSHYNEIVKTTIWKLFVKEHTSLAAEVMEAHFGNN